MKLFGLNENVNDKDFKKRSMTKDKDGLYKPQYRKENDCAKYKFELSELKSSLLVGNILKNGEITDKLILFLKDILLVLDNRNISHFNMYLEYYSEQDPENHYPVGQMKNSDGNPLFIHKNFLGLYNYVKERWVSYHENKLGIIENSKCHNDALNIPIITIYTIQQNLMKTIMSVRGERINVDNGEKNSNIGISNLYSKHIDLKDKHVSGDIFDGTFGYISIDDWKHPGRVQCEVPYTGKYGELLKKYLDNNEYEASVQCGISGSINFILYMYLASIAVNNDNRNWEMDVVNVINCAILVLVSDGGHNIREIITGFTIMAITLKTFLDELVSEIKVNNPTFNIKDRSTIKDVKPGNMGILNQILYHQGYLTYKIIFDLRVKKCQEEYNEFEMYHKILNIFSMWEPFINKLYDYTSEINPLGLTDFDIYDIFPEFNQNKEWYISSTKNLLYRTWFDGTIDVLNDEVSNSAITFYSALDNDRYLLDLDKSFKTFPNDFFINKILFKYSNSKNILNVTNEQLQEKINECEKVNQDSIFSLDFFFRENSKNIPLA